jgi:hypothetical protein
MLYTVIVVNGSNKKRRKGLSVVWHAFVWAVWKARKDRIFNNVVVDVPTVVDHVQRLSWIWFMNNIAKGSFLL